METLFGTLTLIFGVLMSSIGLPAQVIKNYREKSCSWSLLLIFLGTAVYSCRIVYSFLIMSWYIIIPDSIGLAFSSIIAFQYFYYKKLNKKTRCNK